MPTHVIAVNSTTADSTTGGIQLPIYLETVQLTDSEIKALPSTAPQLFAAPGANKIILPLGFIATLNTITSYTNVDPDAIITFGWGDSSGTIADASTYMVAFGSMNAGTPGNKFYFGGVGANIATNAYDYTRSLYLSGGASIVNKAIVATSYNGSLGDYTGGNAGNTLTISIYYVVITQ